jgi:hypothetical protein
MAKPTKRKKRPDPIQLDGPTEAQLANGTYTRDDIIHVDFAQRATVHINRGGTPLARWKDSLSDSQKAGIGHCLRLWELTGLRQSLTANYGQRIAGASNEHRAAVQIDARDDLWRIIDYFPGELRTYWQVFENVCRFDMPAGVAGSDLSQSNRTAEARAHQVVCFVADIIATKERLTCAAP